MDLLRLLRSDEVPSDKNVIWVDTSNNLSPVLKVFIPNRGWVLLDEAYSGDISKEQIINTIREVLKDDNVADKDDITTAISSINIPDISGLATKNELKIVEGKIITSYKDLTDKPYIPSADDFATRNWVEDRPVSTFTNDSGYVTDSSVDTKLSNYVLKKDGYSLVRNSDIEQISKNKSTLNIYGGDVNVVGSIAWQIKEKFKEFNSLQKEIVSQVPQPQDAEPNVLYLLKIGTNKYQQWTLIGNEMLNVGDTDIDLTKYVKKEDLCWNIDENEKNEVTTTNAVVSYVKEYVKNNTINPIVDESPTYLSTNLVTSGGVYEAIKGTVSDKYIAKTEDLDIFSDEDKIVLYIGETNDKYIHNEYYERIDGSWVISPRKVSTLENDAQYQTKQDVDTELLKYVLKEENKSLVSNTDIEQITLNKNAISVLNGGENINGSVRNTILEYIGNSTHLSKEIVSVLPSIDEAVDNTIYLIPFENKQGVYKQYIKIGNEFVQLDNTDIDLSSYYNTDKLEIHSSIDDTRDTASKKYVPNVSAVKSAIDNIDYLKEISKGTDGKYITTTISAKNNKTQTIGISVKIQAISSADEANNGLVEARDVKEYVTNQINAIPKGKFLPLVDNLDNYECIDGTIVKYNGPDGKYINGWDYKFKKGNDIKIEIGNTIEGYNEWKRKAFYIEILDVDVDLANDNILVMSSNEKKFIFFNGESDQKKFVYAISNGSSYLIMNKDENGIPMLLQDGLSIDSYSKLNDVLMLAVSGELTKDSHGFTVFDTDSELTQRVIVDYGHNSLYKSLSIDDIKRLNEKDVYSILSSSDNQYVNKDKTTINTSSSKTVDVGSEKSQWIQHNAQPDISGQVSNLETTVATNSQNILSLQSGKQDKITETNKLSYDLLKDTPPIPTVPTKLSEFTDDLSVGKEPTHIHSQYLTSYTETDPTVPSHVKAITQQNINDWNKSHTQNTDTMLNNGTLKVESNKISATLPIVSSGDIEGVGTDNKHHLLSKKMDSAMLRTYNSFADMVADTQRPAGCWCAIIE